MKRVLSRARAAALDRRRSSDAALPSVADGATPDDRAVLDAIRGYTMTTIERQLALLDVVSYVTEAAIPGAFVECGVWRGGSVLAMILRLQQLGVDDRELYLYDTFEGMTSPTEADVSDYDPPARETWEQTAGKPYQHLFSANAFGEELVRELVLSTGYPEDRVHLIRGPVEETIPDVAPDRIALLRLDTDWYESTLHELIHLYPAVVPGGVIIADDYGHWKGCRRAVDEYLDRAEVARPLLHRTDYTCRTWTKPTSARD